MFEVRLGNGVIMLSSKAALDKVDEVSRNGDFWTYISHLIEADVSSSHTDEKFDKILSILHSGNIVLPQSMGGLQETDHPSTVKETRNESPQMETDPGKIDVVIKPSASAKSALERMRKMSGKKKGE